MAAANLLSESAILKTLYPQTEIEREWHEHMPVYAMLDKKTDFEGANMVLALRYGTTQGRSRTFGNAQANKTPTGASRSRGAVITRSIASTARPSTHAAPTRGPLSMP